MTAQDEGPPMDVEEIDITVIGLASASDTGEKVAVEKPKSNYDYISHS